jgi:hypothetical protein
MWLRVLYRWVIGLLDSPMFVQLFVILSGARSVKSEDLLKSAPRSRKESKYSGLNFVSLRTRPYADT